MEEAKKPGRPRKMVDQMPAVQPEPIPEPVKTVSEDPLVNKAFGIGEDIHGKWHTYEFDFSAISGQIRISKVHESGTGKLGASSKFKILASKHLIH